MKEKQEDEAVLDATPDCDVPVQLVVPYLNGLNQDVQDDVCKHLKSRKCCRGLSC